MTYFRMIAAGLALAAAATPALASDFFREVGNGLYHATENPSWKEAQRAMKEADEREAADRAAARAEARAQKQAEYDRYQRAEYQRRAANPRGPF